MSFKLANVLITFYAYINKALRDLINVIYVVYLKNILIFNNDLI